jgi:hypothetical protein
MQYRRIAGGKDDDKFGWQLCCSVKDTQPYLTLSFPGNCCSAPVVYAGIPYRFVYRLQIGLKRDVIDGTSKGRIVRRTVCRAIRDVLTG